LVFLPSVGFPPPHSLGSINKSNSKEKTTRTKNVFNHLSLNFRQKISVKTPHHQNIGQKNPSSNQLDEGYVN
jgi:hypothetical protein